LHFDTVEARLAFRSRVLDYIWAGLPMVVTRGDATSELIAGFELGEVVDYERDDEVAAALLRLLSPRRSNLAPRFEEARNALTWERAAMPLIEFCRNPKRAPDRCPSEHSPSTGMTVAKRDMELDALRTAITQRDAEIARLRALVAGYERGRFIRFMKWVHDLTHKRVRWLRKRH